MRHRGPVKALTILQPWASLICVEAKRFETRSWSTNYRGPIAIHAGAKPALEEDITPEMIAAFARAGVCHAGISARDLILFLPTGRVLCIAQLIEVIPTEKMTFPGELQLTDEYLFGNYESGRYGWELKVSEVFNPKIPARGAQGLWTWNPDQPNPKEPSMAKAKKETKNNKAAEKPERKPRAAKPDKAMDESQAKSEKDAIADALSKSAPVEREGVPSDPAFAAPTPEVSVVKLPAVKTYTHAPDPTENLPAFQKVVFVSYTEAEFATKGKEMAAVDLEIGTLEKEMKEVVGEWKERIAAKESTRRALSSMVSSGGQEQEIECLRRVNEETGMMTIFNKETMEIVEERKLNSKELQTELLFTKANASSKPTGSKVVDGKWPKGKKLGTSAKENAEIDELNEMAVQKLAEQAKA